MTDLVVVTVESHLGSTYTFPDMPRAMLETIIKSSGWESVGRMILVNVSGAVLSIEARVVKTVSYDGEVKWLCPV